MAFARVQGRNHQNGSGSSTTVACGSGDGLTAIVSGNTVMVQVGWASTAGDTVTRISDDKGNTYALVDLAREPTTGYSYQTAYLANVTNAPSTITATLSASRTFAAITVQEESGIATASPLDGHAIQAQHGPGTGTDAVTSGNVTPTTSGDLILGVCVNINGTTAAPGYGTGYTGRDNFSNAFESEDRVQSVAAAIAATFTAGNSADAANGWITGVMAFRAAAAAAGIVGRVLQLNQARVRAAYW